MCRGRSYRRMRLASRLAHELLWTAMWQCGSVKCCRHPIRRNAKRSSNSPLDTPGHGVAVVTSEHQKLLELEVIGDNAHILIGVDDADEPSVVCIEVS